MSQILLLIFLIQVGTHVNAQRFYYQDTLIFPKELQILEKILFPTQEGPNKQTIFDSCSTDRIKLQLLLRSNRPDPDQAIEQLRQVYFLKDTLLLPHVKNLYYRHLEYFQMEWGWAVLENLNCTHLRKQLEIIEAFERCIFGLTIYNKLQFEDSSFNLLMNYTEAHVMLRLYKLIKNAPSKDSLRLHQTYGEETISYISSIPNSKIQEMVELMNKKRISEYTTYISNTHNAFGGIGLDWNIFSPFLEKIKPKLLDLFEQYSKISNLQSLEYRVYSNLFRIQLGKTDQQYLGISSKNLNK